MKKILLTLAFLSTVLAACKNSSAENKMDKVSNLTATIDTLCYEFKFKKDVTSCQLIIDGDKVRGYFDWMPFEKDGGHGILQDGIKKGDMITVDWKMMIEGSVQKEQILFKMDGEKLIQMEGELVEKGDKLVLKSPETAVSGDILTKVDCTQIAQGIENAKSAAEIMNPVK